MNTRKKMLALLFTAICLLGILPLSVSAYTPAIEGASYKLISPLIITQSSPDYNMTPICGQLDYFSCEGSVDNVFNTVAIDFLSTSEITDIGFINNEQIKAVVFNTIADGILYIPEIESVPLPFEDVPWTLAFVEAGGRLVMLLISDGDDPIATYVQTDVSFTLTDILDTTDLSILNTTLDAFSVELITDNYVNWILGGYNSLIDVFVNNAKIQYVMDNPIFIIALVVFAMAIAFAVATFIFKIFRRY